MQALYCGEGMKALHSTHASSKAAFENIFMNGSEVFKFAVRAVPSVRFSTQFRQMTQDRLSVVMLLMSKALPAEVTWSVLLAISAEALAACCSKGLHVQQ